MSCRTQCIFRLSLCHSDVYANSHASIDPALRAERGLPEDLIRLCVGIEDPVDLIDDLEHALLEAGAITASAGADQHQFVRASLPRGGVAISRAVEKLAYNEHATRKTEDREWFVSAPGKVILFGEHAVVHGVVSNGRNCFHSCDLMFPQTAIAASVGLRCLVCPHPAMMAKFRCTSSTWTTSRTNGSSMTFRGMPLRPLVWATLTPMHSINDWSMQFNNTDSR